MLNSSGGYAANKHIAARQDSMANIAAPDATGSQDSGSEPHSVTIHKTPQGFHSVTQGADDSVEHQDHPSYEDAKSHMDSKFAGSGEEESDGDGSEQMNDSGEDNEDCV